MRAFGIVRPRKCEVIMIIDEIIELEWNQFDKVNNEGGRADCQDDFATFNIMRRSQFMVFTDELLESYKDDLITANETHQNLIEQKYARMMASTAPQQYSEIEPYLPVKSDEQREHIENIISIQIPMMEEFARMYPKMAGNARSIHTYEDSAYNTSYETYLRGELLSYSLRSVLLYEQMIRKMKEQGENIAKLIMTNTALLYGYDSLEHAEASLE